MRGFSTNESGVPWGSGISGSAGAEVIATDSTGLEWRDLIDDSGNFNLNLYRGN